MVILASWLRQEAAVDDRCIALGLTRPNENIMWRPFI